jgi:1,4-dihydroxy-2-naphthoate polyprenyltransferase
MNAWVAGARPRTLPASVVPVVVGTACAYGQRAGGLVWWRVAAAIVVALALQIATNYANDYSDGIKGTDDVRVGPIRLVGSGLKSAKSVKLAAFLAFGVAGVAGGALALAVGPELFAVGVASILAGWFYTGGPKPYGYLGLGEVFVFVFFGLVATVGSTYVQLHRITALSVVAGAAMGCLSCALLVVNNLRDIPGDTVAGKKTLAVRFGDPKTRQFYRGLITAAFLLGVVTALWRPLGALSIVALPAALAPILTVMRGAKGKDLIPVLGGTGKLQLAFGVLLTIGIIVSA